MPHAPTTCKVEPADNDRLAGLMKLFGCADVVAPLNAEVFAERAGELIVQGVGKRLPSLDARIRQQLLVIGKYRSAGIYTGAAATAWEAATSA
jgi:hypothetical protein